MPVPKFLGIHRNIWMCLSFPSFTDYVGSRRTNFDPRSVQKRLEINFGTRPKMVPRWSWGDLGMVTSSMVVQCSQPETYCSNKNMLVSRDHDCLQGPRLSANIMILCKDHDPLPAIWFSQQKLAWCSSTHKTLSRAQNRHADIHVTSSSGSYVLSSNNSSNDFLI